MTNESITGMHSRLPATVLRALGDTVMSEMLYLTPTREARKKGGSLTMFHRRADRVPRISRAGTRSYCIFSWPVPGPAITDSRLIELSAAPRRRGSVTAKKPSPNLRDAPRRA